MIYMGFRIGEVLALTTENIHLDKGYIIGGIKTDAGKNRIVPFPYSIPNIKKFVSNWMKDVAPGDKLFKMSSQTFRIHCFYKPHMELDSPDSVWTSDVTYFKFKDRFYYICTVIDLFSRKVIAYSISKANNTRLTLSALKKAIAARPAKEGVIYHSDNGTNYTSKTFEKCLAANDIKHSYSRTQTPHDNAVSESFFSSMKREELYRRKISSEQQLFKVIEDYIEFYNKKRPLLNSIDLF